MLETIHFKSPDLERALIHSVEKRGTVTVPFDHAGSVPGELQIFYRLIPAYGSSPDDSSKPVIVIMNGGPGIPSSVYRPLEFDYQDPASPKNGTWRGPWVEKLDREPPPATPYPSIEELRSAIGRHQLLFAAADNDAYVPAEGYLKSMEKFLVEGHTEVRRLRGGHHAIFLEEGYAAFMEWSRGLRSREPGNTVREAR